MFSGIVETIGNIIHLEISNGCKHFTIRPEKVFTDLVIGESIAINGVCLTVTAFTENDFQVTAVPETLRCTNLDNLSINSLVNVERSMRLGARLGGHFVQGHVDGIGQILERKQDEQSDALIVKISVTKELAKYIITKGFITLDGMSITVIETTADWFTVTFIPHTQAVTITQHYKIGNFINIEVDMLSKYIENMIGVYSHANTH